ncbi:hypothetical protein AK812_SmicGene41665 [Symbiodinium microadriaticum]|uniref:Uncharacterized protein n=1 Tax=Symbiodinium microadriaticum TaxID=2951 RepID=A0A1Q9C5J8_SYMMI|nr:hypothetical protein AK812_SmicGene41665 [Symbiodinium microadriaticum]
MGGAQEGRDEMRWTRSYKEATVLRKWKTRGRSPVAQVTQEERDRLQEELDDATDRIEYMTEAEERWRDKVAKARIENDRLLQVDLERSSFVSSDREGGLIASLLVGFNLAYDNRTCREFTNYGSNYDARNLRETIAIFKRRRALMSETQTCTRLVNVEKELHKSPRHFEHVLELVVSMLDLALGTLVLELVVSMLDLALGTLVLELVVSTDALDENFVCLLSLTEAVTLVLELVVSTDIFHENFVRLLSPTDAVTLVLELVDDCPAVVKLNRRQDADQMLILMNEWKIYVIKADYERQLEAAEARRRREVEALEEELRKERDHSAALQVGVPSSACNMLQANVNQKTAKLIQALRAWSAIHPAVVLENELGRTRQKLQETTEALTAATERAEIVCKSNSTFILDLDKPGNEFLEPQLVEVTTERDELRSRCEELAAQYEYIKIEAGLDEDSIAKKKAAAKAYEAIGLPYLSLGI